MREDRRQLGVGIGGSSILAIFVVLCLTTFATLSLVSAQADERLAEKASEALALYYEADSQAEAKLYVAAGVLRSGENWEKDFVSMGITWEKGERETIIQYYYSIAAIKTLQVKAGISFDEEGNVRINRYQWLVQVQPE